MLLGNCYYTFFSYIVRNLYFAYVDLIDSSQCVFGKKWTSCPRQVNGKLFWAHNDLNQAGRMHIKCSLERKNIYIDLSCRKKFLKYHSHSTQYRKKIHLLENCSLGSIVSPIWGWKNNKEENIDRKNSSRAMWAAVARLLGLGQTPYLYFTWAFLPNHGQLGSTQIIERTPVSVKRRT